MSKSIALNEHFAKWRATVNVPEDSFHADGIVDEELWHVATTKVCFLMKEPNNPSGHSFDFRLRWNEAIKQLFARRLSEWAAGVQNGFPPYEKILRSSFDQYRHPALRSSALVNVKKTSGGGSAEYKSFMAAIGPALEEQEATAELVREQLRIIEPDVVIMGLSWGGLRERLFPSVSWHKTGYAVPVGRWEGCKLIDFYHPSARNAPAASYCLLQKVMEGEVYGKL